MKIPNFKSEEGSILYKNTVGRLISPRVAEVLLTYVKTHAESARIKSVLDLACGPGTVSLPLAKAYSDWQITAVDSSDSMIALAQDEATKQGLQNLLFQQMDAGHIDLPPENFDLVLCNLAFPFFARPTDSMREVHSVIRPGGSAYFTVPGRNTWSEFFDVAKSILGDMISVARPFLSKFSQAEVLPDALSSAGFINVVEERVLLPFEFTSGEDVLTFFGQLFHMLDYASADMKSELAEAINHSNPNGFTMHYEAVLLSGQRPTEQER